MKKLIYFFGALVLFASCSSPLSDTPVSDPGLVTPNIILQHAEDDYGVSNKVNACLSDKNGAYIELLEGDIKVEGDLMEFGVTCYKRTIDVKENKDYQVVITLADSTAYPFTVTTPTFFKKVDYPGKVKKGEAFDVSWKGDGGETKVNFSVKDTASNWVIVFEEYVSGNSVTIDPDNFPGGDIDKGMLNLTRTTKGKMPSGFNGGSIVSKCTFEKTIKIK